jgi:S1-C subfamily serine protease
MPFDSGDDESTSSSQGDQTWSTWARAEPPTRPLWLDEPAVTSPPLAEDPLGPPPFPSDPASRPDLVGEPPTESRPATGGGPRWPLVALLGALVGALVASVLSIGITRALDDDATTPRSVAASRASSRLAGAQLDIRGVLEAVRPGVVSITERDASGRSGAGTGMVIQADGLVLTNAHVVNGAQEIHVQLEDGSDRAADLVGSFPTNDVALIKVRGVSGLATVQLGQSSALQVGDEVVAVGNALGLGAEPTVTRGIVSALERELQVDENDAQTKLQHLIQTDAAINPGNSGGPLVNARGQVVGVNTVIAAEGQNIGFALAIDSIKPLIEGIKEGKAAVTVGPLLGVSTVSINNVTPPVLNRFGIDREDGAFVQDVVTGSGADRAGLQPGDVITAVDGERIRNNQDVFDEIAKHQPDEQVTITFERDGKERTVTATLGRREVTQGGR